MPMINSSFDILVATCEISGKYSEDKEIELIWEGRTLDLKLEGLIQVQSDHFDNWVPMTHPTPKFILSGEEEITFDIVFSPNGEVDWVEENHGVFIGKIGARVLSFDGTPTYGFSGGRELIFEFETLACDGPICHSISAKNVLNSYDYEHKEIKVSAYMDESGEDFQNLGIYGHGQDRPQINTTEISYSNFVFRKADLKIGKENSLNQRITINGFDETNFSSWKSLENGTSIQIENLIIEARIDSLNDHINSSEIHIEIEAYYAPDPNDTNKEDSFLPGYSYFLAILSILCGAMFYSRNCPTTEKSR